MLSAAGALALMAAGLSAPACADTITTGTFNFTLSEFAGTQQFGTITITAIAGGVHVFEDVAPNFVIDNGGPHQPLAFNLVNPGAASIVNIEPNTPANGSYSAVIGSNVGASPFGDFNTSIQSTCSPGSSGTGDCHTMTLAFDIMGFSGFSSTNFGGTPIFFASDISAVAPDCTGGSCTGNVGATGQPSPVPGPIVGAGIPGLLAAFGMIGLARRRRNQHRAT